MMTTVAFGDDDDGVCVIRRAEALTVLAAARKRIEAEEAKRQRLAAGELGLDIDDMRGRLEAKGLLRDPRGSRTKKTQKSVGGRVVGEWGSRCQKKTGSGRSGRSQTLVIVRFWSCQVPKP